MKLLLIEDHQQIARTIFEYFEMKQQQLDHAATGELGLNLARTQHYDLIILDVMLPDIDGLYVCQRLREQGIDTPVLMLTARDTQDDMLQGFDCGADDYLIKPFDLRVLEARLKAIYQRTKGLLGTQSLCFEDLYLDLKTHQVTRAGKQINLNKAQFCLLKMLMLRAPSIVTREEMIHELWQDDEPEDDLLRNHVYRLRTMIDKPFSQAYIKTAPKVGYQLCLA